MTLLIFFLILSILILIHEFGHFFVAKKSGVKVHEFGLGLPPKIIGKKIGETEYTLNLLPIGGFVRIEGEDPSEKVTDKERNFQTKSPIIKLAILLAGVFMNTLLAIVLFYTFFLANNFLSSPIVKFTNFNFIGAKEYVLQNVISGTEREELKGKVDSGDVIYNAEYKGNKLSSITSQEIFSSNKAKAVEKLSKIDLKEFQEFINKSEGDVKIYLYNVQTKESKEIVVKPEYNKELDRKVMGVFLGSLVYLDYGTSIFSKALSGIYHSYNVLGYSLKAFGEIIYYSFVTRDVSAVSSGVGGPVQIFSIIQEVLKSGINNVIWILIDLMAILSLSLAFMNLLPIPALDGGRALFVLYEGITGKKPNPELEAQLHKYGMIFLLLLLALITVKDVLNLF